MRNQQRPFYFFSSLDNNTMSFFNPQNRQRTGSLLVALQFGLLLFLGVLCTPQIRDGQSSWVAVGLAVMSAIWGGWTLLYNRLGNFNIHPEPKVNGVLVTGGPYRLVRHPMYGAVLLAAAALTALSASWLGALAWGSLLWVLWQKATLEEQWLCEHHAGYAAYRQTTKRFIPGMV